MENNFNLAMDEDNIEELLEVVPEKLTNEEVLELEHECIAQETETSGEEKESLRKFSEGFNQSNCRPQ